MYIFCSETSLSRVAIIIIVTLSSAQIPLKILHVALFSKKELPWYRPEISPHQQQVELSMHADQAATSCAHYIYNNEWRERFRTACDV